MSKENEKNLNYEELYNELKKDYDALLETYNSIINKRKNYSKDYYNRNREKFANYAKEYHQRKKEEKKCQKDSSAASAESK